MKRKIGVLIIAISIVLITNILISQRKLIKSRFEVGSIFGYIISNAYATENNRSYCKEI